MPNIRIDRVNAEMQKCISEIITNELRNPIVDNEIISVAEVITSVDLAQAKVYLSILSTDDKKKQIFDAILKSKGFIRKRTGEKMQLRVVPDLIFIFDESMERGSKVLKIIEGLQFDDNNK